MSDEDRLRKSKRINMRSLQINFGVPQTIGIGGYPVMSLAENPSNQTIDMWYEGPYDVDKHPLSDRKFCIFLTGAIVPPGYDHVGTVRLEFGIVAHVYRQAGIG